MAKVALLCALFLVSLAECTNQTSCFSIVGTAVHTLPGALPQCSYMNSYYASCGDLPKTAVDGCLCKQKVLDVLYECDNEMKLCLDTDDTGPHGVQEIISDWHVVCDNSISFSPTTPSTVVLGSQTYNSEYCTAVASACGIGTSLQSSCFLNHPASTQPDQFSSCICQQQVLSVASVCEYDGNKTCLGAPAALTNIPQWTFCSMEVAAFMSSQAAEMSQHASFSTSLPPLPGHTTTTAQAHTAHRPTSTSMAMSTSSMPNGSPGRLAAPRMPLLNRQWVF